MAAMLHRDATGRGQYIDLSQIEAGIQFQAPLLLKWRRVLDNVLLPAELLGLPMARAILERQGGKIRYEHPDGGGAAFVFTVPLTATGKTEA